MTVDLRVYGNLEEFSLNDAAYLFLDREPRDEYEHSPPKVVADMQKELNRRLAHLPGIEGCKFAGQDPRTGEFYFSTASRSALLKVANDLKLTPIFLFPEMVQNASEITTLTIEERPLNSKKRNSYLRLIKGLLKKLDMNPSERGVAQELEKLTELADDRLGEDTIVSAA
jgi:hypothetical protein